VRHGKAASGKWGIARGRAAEERCLLRARDVVAALPWATGCRKAHGEEDWLGIDIVVESDVGQLWIQVKSSKRGARRGRARYEMRGIDVVVVNETRSDWQVESDIVAALAAQRALRQSQRRAS